MAGAGGRFRRTLAWLAAALDLTADQADGVAIDAAMRSGALFRGTNLWLLVFATLIASIGLNVNSAAVIIGAMLISPLMGPIMAVGYGAAVNDFPLIRTAARQLALAVAFSLVASTAYFLVTPLSEARSEILARTSPTIWDVAIALFGGFAGMVGATRREKSNVIPGVAIATALMPPLCTAGHGLATGQLRFVFGAFYLFSINSVFIATATLVMARVMALPEVTAVDEGSQATTRRGIGLVVLLTGIPSVWLAADLVRQELYLSRAESFLQAAFPVGAGPVVVAKEVDPTEKLLRITLVGDEVDDAHREALESSLAAAGLPGTRIEIAQARRGEVDVASLRAQVADDLRQNTLVALDQKSKDIEALRLKLAEAETLAHAADDELEAVVAELRATVPAATSVAIGRGLAATGDDRAPTLVVALGLPEPLDDEARERLVAWLRVRTRVDRVDLVIDAPRAPAGRRR
jgi:uncharacterized hydrophobic protein (TIGR00271 family)